MARCGPIVRAAAGARAPKTANAITGSEVSSPAGAGAHAQPVAHLVEDRADAHRRGPQVDGEHNQATEDQGALQGAGRPAPRAGHPPIPTDRGRPSPTRAPG